MRCLDQRQLSMEAVGYELQRTFQELSWSIPWWIFWQCKLQKLLFCRDCLFPAWINKVLSLSLLILHLPSVSNDRKSEIKGKCSSKTSVLLFHLFIDNQEKFWQCVLFWFIFLTQNKFPGILVVLDYFIQNHHLSSLIFTN